MKVLANRVSGTDGCVLALSVIVEVIKTSNLRNRYKYPFYGTDINTSTNQGGEWVKEDLNKQVARQILKDAKKDKLKYFINLEKTVKKEASEFKKYSRHILKTLSTSLSDQELINLYNSFILKYIYYYGPGALSFLYESIISDWLYASLSKKYHDNTTQVISQLLESSYQSFMIASEILLHQINKSSDIKRKNLVKEYLGKFFFINTNYLDAPVLNETQILEKAKTLKAHKDNFKAIKIKFKLSEDEKIMARLLKLSTPIRDQRKYINLIGGYLIFRFLDQALKKHKINRELAKRMFWFEFKDLIFNTEKLLTRLKKDSLSP